MSHKSLTRPASTRPHTPAENIYLSPQARTQRPAERDRDVRLARIGYEIEQSMRKRLGAMTRVKDA